MGSHYPRMGVLGVIITPHESKESREGAFVCVHAVCLCLFVSVLTTCMAGSSGV
jgi:hypothetical protein